MEENMLIKIYPNELLDILIEAGISDQEAKSLVYDILMMKMLPEKVQSIQPVRRTQQTVVHKQTQQHNDSEDEDDYDQPSRPVTQVRRSVSGQNMNFSNFGQDFKGLKK